MHLNMNRKFFSIFINFTDSQESIQLCRKEGVSRTQEKFFTVPNKKERKIRLS